MPALNSDLHLRRQFATELLFTSITRKLLLATPLKGFTARAVLAVAVSLLAELLTFVPMDTFLFLFYCTTPS